MMMTLSHKESNMNRFWYGNLKSLDQPNIRDHLLAFHKKWYSSNIMKLVISSKSSLDELEKLAVEKFTPIVNKKVVLPDLGLPITPYTSENLGKLIKIIPVADTDSITIMWNLPNCHLHHHLTQPLNYFTTIFGSEQTNSVFSHLKKEGLIMSLSSYSEGEFNGVYSTFYVYAKLTKKGL